MPKGMSLANVIEKNKIASGNAFLVTMEIQLVDSSTGLTVDTIFVVNNNEDITYKSQLYTAFPFDLTIRQESGGIPEITLTAMDYQSVLIQHLNNLSGATGSLFIMRVINSGNLSGDAELEETLELVKSSGSNFSVSLTLGAENALNRNFPSSIQMRDRCRWRYKSTECGYVGALPTCDLTLQGPNGCAAHANTPNFGGFPGLKGRGVRYGS